MIDLEDVNNIISLLSKEHSNAVCELNYSTTFELLIAVILSAQCTDKRVNFVTQELFKHYNTPQAFADLAVEEVIPYIHACGFYNSKSRAIIDCSKSLVDNFGGNVPSTMQELMSLRGVGRKTANVVLNVAFHMQTMAVDTHVKRLANRIGFIQSDNVLKIEQALQEQVPQDKWSQFHHLLIHHGRYTCTARAPKCHECSINKYCKNFFIAPKRMEIK